MIRALPGLLLLSFIFSACDEAGNDSRFTARDSAGIAIVEAFSPSWADNEAWTVDFAPIIDLAESGEGSNHEFFNATDATRLSDGSFVVADDGTDEVRLFSSDGAFMMTLGGTGAGPGEFQRLDQVFALPGDSILAYDFWEARITVFDPAGGVARVTRVEGAYRPRPLLPLETGDFVGKSTDFTGFGDQLGIQRLQSPIVRVNQDGAVLDTLITIPGGESLVLPRGDARPMWARNGHIAVFGDRVYLGTADSVQYEVRSPDGSLLRIVRLPGYDLTLTRDDIESEYSALVPDPSKLSPPWREIMDAQPDRSHRPGYSDMVVDVFDAMWLKRYQGRHEQDAPTEWFVFDTDGKWLGVVDLPPRFDIFRIGPDWILGKQPDELDVEHIQLLRLSRQQEE